MNRLRTPDYIAGAGGLLLLISLFAPWYTLSDGTADGWRSLGFIDIWLLITAAMAIALTVITAINDDPALPIKWDVLSTWVTLLAAILVVYRLISVANSAFVTGRSWGIFLAAAAVVVTFTGTWWAMRLQAAPGLRTPPEVRAMPAPPATDPTRPTT